jgi:hypothetical protein
MNFTITLNYHHAILIIGAVGSLIIMFKGYDTQNDRLGIEGMMRFSGSAIWFLLFSSIWLFGKYMEWFT